MNLWEFRSFEILYHLFRFDLYFYRGYPYRTSIKSIKSNVSARMRISKHKLEILKHKALWKMYLYSYCFGVIFSCDSLFRPVVKPVSKVNLYFFSAGGRSFLDESHLGSFACLVSILVEVLLSVALKCTWITFQCSQLRFDLDHKRNSFSNRVWRGVYCH